MLGTLVTHVNFNSISTAHTLGMHFKSQRGEISVQLSTPAP